MENKEQQKNLITEIMNEDQKDGLYKKQTAVEWLIDQIKNEDYHTEGELGNSCIDVNTLLMLCEQAKQMEEQHKNTLPIHIHEGVENVWVYIEDGIVHVKHYDEFNVDKAKEISNFVAIKFNPAKLKLDAEQYYNETYNK